MNRSFLFLAPGFEEIEALTVVDVMRRAGMDVKTVSIIPDLMVTGAHGVTVKADALFSETHFDNIEWIIVPGGLPGSSNLAEYAPLCTLLKEHAANGGRIAAICAAPAFVLGSLGLLDGRECTGYPGTQASVEKAIWRDAPVIALDTLVTGNGPASAMRFALAIVANSMGENIAQQIGSGMLFYPKSMNFYF
ncbi:DJ-1/PfpI family protein [Muribaculaceae bacterium Isolate-002 (NCI)]|nr:DJ-1/PfpI family protein [Muribaculaceae bacterium Isolate-002 (NCI)]